MIFTGVVMCFFCLCMTIILILMAFYREKTQGGRQIFMLERTTVGANPALNNQEIDIQW